jgi:hypothetical protein
MRGGCGLGLGRHDIVVRDRSGRGRRRLGLGRGRLLHHGLGLGLGAPLGLGLRLGLVDDGLAPEPLGVGQTPDAVGRRVVDARRVALHADLEPLGEVEHHLVLDAELSCQLVDADLLRSQARCLCFLYFELHAAPSSLGTTVPFSRDITVVQSRA